MNPSPWRKCTKPGRRNCEKRRWAFLFVHCISLKPCLSQLPFRWVLPSLWPLHRDLCCSGRRCSKKVLGESGWHSGRKYTWETRFHQQHSEHPVQTLDGCCANVWQKYGLSLLLGISAAFWYTNNWHSHGGVVYLKLFIQKDSICQSVYSSHVNGQNLHNNPEKKIWDLLQIMVSTGCIECSFSTKSRLLRNYASWGTLWQFECPLKLKIGMLGLAFGFLYIRFFSAFQNQARELDQKSVLPEARSDADLTALKNLHHKRSYES